MSLSRLALAAGLRNAGRGSRWRERERVRGRLAAGRLWFGYRAPLTLTRAAHATRSTRTAHATATAHARRPVRLVVVLCVCAAFWSGPAYSQDDDAADASQTPRLRPPSPSMETEAKPEASIKVPSLKVVRVQFRGNRKVEDDAIRVNLHTLPDSSLNKDTLQEDVRTIWKMGYFEDVQVETTDAPGGVVLTYVLKE